MGSPRAVIVPLFHHCCLLFFLKYCSRQPSKTRQPRCNSSASRFSLCDRPLTVLLLRRVYERARACLYPTAVGTGRVGAISASFFFFFFFFRHHAALLLCQALLCATCAGITLLLQVVGVWRRSAHGTGSSRRTAEFSFRDAAVTSGAIILCLCVCALVGVRFPPRSSSEIGKNPRKTSIAAV